MARVAARERPTPCPIAHGVREHQRQSRDRRQIAKTRDAGAVTTFGPLSGVIAGRYTTKPAHAESTTGRAKTSASTIATIATRT